MEKSSRHSINLGDSIETNKRKKINKKRRLKNEKFHEKTKNVNFKPNFESRDNEDMSSQISEFYASLSKECSEPSSSFQNISSAVDNEDAVIMDTSTREESEIFPFTENERKSYLGIKSFKKGTLSVVILPGTKLFIKGYYYLKLVFGSISVLGYLFKENEEHAIFSPPIFSFLSIDVLSGINQKDFGQMGRSNIPTEWLEELDIPDVSQYGFITVKFKIS